VSISPFERNKLLTGFLAVALTICDGSIAVVFHSPRPDLLVGGALAQGCEAPTVISEAGVDPIVSALVYVAARAPDAGEDYAALAAKFPRHRQMPA